MVLPAVVVDAVLAEELTAARAWSDRTRTTISWSSETRILVVQLSQPETGEQFYLNGRFDDYRAIPPAWRWTDETASLELTRRDLCPKPIQGPFGSSIFIDHNGTGLICAPFNRLAFAVHKGPHGDWGNPIQWGSAGGNHVRASRIGDMLQVIRAHFLFTRGRLS